MPSISVIIPTHDRKLFLAEALDCILHQTLSPSEVVIVDNGAGETSMQGGGTDPGADFIRPVRHIRTVRNAGASQARNVGATVATGDYLAFLDDDDLWGKEYLEKAARLIEQDPCDILVARLDLLTEAGGVPWRMLTKETLNRHSLLRSNPGVTGSNMVIRRDFFLALGGFNPLLRTGEDKGLLLDALEAGAEIRLVQSMQAMHREHGLSSLSKDKMDVGLSDFAARYANELGPLDVLYTRLKAAHHAHMGGGGHIFRSLAFRVWRKIRVLSGKGE